MTALVELRAKAKNDASPTSSDWARKLSRSWSAQDRTKTPNIRPMGTTARRWWGSIFLVGSVGTTVLLGVLSGSDRPPSRSTSALLVLVAAVFQLGSVLLFSGIGRADPGLARAAVRRLVRMGLRAEGARVLAEESFDSASASELRSRMGQLSVDLSWMEEGLLEAVGDWEEFHADALKTLRKADQRE